MRKVLGYVWPQVTPSTEIRKCADCVGAEDTCRCWFVFAVESGGTVSRVADRSCGGTAGREESGVQGNEIARCEFVLDGLDCGNLEWKLHEGSAGISSHLHDDHGIGAARFDKELDNWPGDWTTSRWLRFAMRTMWC